MLTGININETKPYFSKLDPVEPKTKFMLGVLDPAVRAYIEDQTTLYERDEKGNPRMRIMFDQRFYLSVKFGLRGTENLKDPVTGAPVEFKTEFFYLNNRGFAAVANDIMSMLGIPGLMDELGLTIWNWNDLSEQEAKN
jgi:hypothetical protein